MLLVKRFSRTWSVGVAAAALALVVLSEAQTQTRISNDTVKIGVLSDMSSLYADNSGPGSVAAAPERRQD
jgi:branched-chain amino acid transport system substrate-binding protein